ncbi:MAG: hypothetical protein KGD72_10950 [Candidatus Lokiarchaeota archaeon]|nr:hypothetical protein [Candidatus Lokiarchaeota archaeon]
MIDEEDDEDFLNKKRSMKSILKNLLLIGLIAIGVLFIYIGGPDQVFNMVIGFGFICLGTTLFQMGKNTSDPIRQTLTILKCKSCSAIKVRNYEDGDFIFKSMGSCDKCNKSMEIDQIYSVKLKKSRKKDDKLEKSKKKLLETIEV